MNTLIITTLVATAALVGPPIERTKIQIKILIDSKSKDEIILYRSRCVKEIFIKDNRWFPAQCYYIHNYFNIEVIEYEDTQWVKVPKVPAFKFGKNGAWQEFCPGTFAGPGMFTLSIFSLCRWYQFDEEYASFKTIQYGPMIEKESLPIIPNSFPEQSIEFYDRAKFINNLHHSEYNSSYYNIFKFDNKTSVDFTIPPIKELDFDKINK